MSARTFSGMLVGTALRDQVAAAIRDADLPISTTAICRSLGTYRLRGLLCGHAGCPTPEHWKDYGERQYHNHQIASALRGLEREGLVERFRTERIAGVNPHGAHHWRWLGER
jgi:hypothetical protein